MSSRKKNILYICQYFYPEVFRGNDIAFHWAEEGHNVHVLTGIPNYPDGEYFKGYGLFKKRKEVIKGVKVTRLPIFPRGKNKIMLMLNYFSYYIVSCIYIIFHSLFHKYDCVFVQQLSPVMMSVPGILYKKLRGGTLYTWVLDLWPESLSVAGGINNKYILGFFDLFVKSEYKHSDKILTSSRSFEESILRYGNYKDKICFFPQWAEDSISSESDYDFSLPTLPKGFKIMFAGAIGEAHGFECNMRAALLTKEHENIKWIIIGDGRKLSWVRDFIRNNNLENTVFPIGKYPVETMSSFFKEADVMLVSLNDSPLFNMYAPAKLSAYMASGKPILAVMNGEGAEVVKTAKCGWSIKADDAENFAKLVIELSQTDKEVLKEKGLNGLKYYNEHLIKENSLEKLDKLMNLK